MANPLAYPAGPSLIDPFGAPAPQQPDTTGYVNPLAYPGMPAPAPAPLAPGQGLSRQPANLDDPAYQAALTQQRETDSRQQMANSGLGGGFEAGVAGGVEGLGADYHALVGKAQAALGFQDAAVKSLRRAQAINQDAASYTPAGAGSFSDAEKSGNWGSYIGHTVGGMVPGAA